MAAFGQRVSLIAAYGRSRVYRANQPGARERTPEGRTGKPAGSCLSLTLTAEEPRRDTPEPGTRGSATSTGVSQKTSAPMDRTAAILADLNELIWLGLVVAL